MPTVIRFFTDRNKLPIYECGGLWTASCCYTNELPKYLPSKGMKVVLPVIPYNFIVTDVICCYICGAEEVAQKKLILL